MGRETASVDGDTERLPIPAGDVDERRHEIDERDAGGDAARRKAARAGDDERDAAGPVKEAHLVPEAAFAEHFAMIAGQDDDRILRQAGGAQRRHQAAQQVVDIGDCTIIGVARVAHLRLRHRFGVHGANAAQASRMGVERLGRDCRRRHVDVGIAIEVPVALRHGEGIVRMRERGHEQKRPPISGARDIEDRALGHEGGFVVEVDLVCAHADPGLPDRAHVVIPARTMLGMVPVRGPAKIGGIDIGRQPLFEPVQLIRPTEMHFS